ncbi:MAG: alpha/beta fold hydrolase, partial [Bacteroidota bacterium]
MKFIKRTLLIILSLLGLLCLLLLTQCHSDIPLQEMKVRYAPAPSEFMTIEGQRVHFRDQGSGAPVLLLHGMGASLHTWEPWVAALQDSFRLISVDLPAFGLSGPHPQHDYSLQAYLDFMHRFAERLALDSFSIVGNSLGGAIAWNYA